MKQNKNQYYFSIVQNQIIIDTEAENSFNQTTRFRFKYIKDHKEIGFTQPILYKCDSYKHINIDHDKHIVKIYSFDENLNQTCVIQFTELSQNNQEILLGTYQFPLNNYVESFQQFSRSCIDIAIEISINVTIRYEFFIQKTYEALEYIIHQHMDSKKLVNIHHDDSQEESFAPQQLMPNRADNDQNEGIIQFETYSPIPIRRSFTNTKKIIRKCTESFETKAEQSQEIESQQKISPPRRKLFLTKSNSILSSDLIKSKIKRSKKKIDMLQDQKEEEIEERKKFTQQFIKLYEVIHHQAKITYPEDQERPRPITDRLFLKPSLVEKRLVKSLKLPPAPLRKEGKKKIFTIKFFIQMAVVMLLLVFALRWDGTVQNGQKTIKKQKIKKGLKKGKL